MPSAARTKDRPVPMRKPAALQCCIQHRKSSMPQDEYRCLPFHLVASIPGSSAEPEPLDDSAARFIHLVVGKWVKP